MACAALIWMYGIGWLASQNPRKYSVERLSFPIKERATKERIEAIVAAFLTGFNSMIRYRSFNRIRSRLDRLPPFFRPFAYEGAGMGYGLRFLLMGRFPGRMERVLSRLGAEYIHLYYVGLGWWLEMWYGLAKPRKVKAVIAKLDPRFCHLAYDGMAFRATLLGYTRAPELHRQFEQFEPRAQRALYQGHGRALLFPYRDQVGRAVEECMAVPLGWREAAVSGLGLAAAFTTLDDARLFFSMARQVPPEYRRAFCSGAAVGWWTRRLNDVLYFGARLNALPEQHRRFILETCASADRHLALISGESPGTDYLDWWLELAQDVPTKLPQDEVTLPKRGVQPVTAVVSPAGVAQERSTIVNVDRLVKRYGDYTAVKGVSLSIEEGEVFGFLGPNGAGKTTTISILCCLIPPTEGTVRICGHDLAREKAQVKKLIGLVPQDIALYPTLSARDNLIFFGAMYGMYGRGLRRRVDEVLEAVGLADRARQPVGTFSGGMKRRVNIGAGLLHRPRALFLDEPTVGVDPQSRSYIFDLVQRLNKEFRMTIIYTSHYMEEVQLLCERAAIMDQGQIIAMDSISHMLETRGKNALMIKIDDPVWQESSRVADALTDVPGVTSVKPVPSSEQGDDAFWVRVEVNEPARCLQDVISALNLRGVPVAGIELQKPNLESIFLELTGRRLRD